VGGCGEGGRSGVGGGGVGGGGGGGGGGFICSHCAPNMFPIAPCLFIQVSYIGRTCFYVWREYFLGGVSNISELVL